MSKNKKKKKKLADRIAPVIIGIILVVCSMIPVSSSLFGQTGYITEIIRTERVGGREDINGQPNAYKWTVAYKFKMENGEIETGSVTVHGDAISPKSGLRVGSPIRYLAFYPGFNTPGEGGLDGSTVIWIVTAAFGVFMITLGVRKEKPSKTPSQRSREYHAAKASRENQPPAVQTNTTNQQGFLSAEPDWDSFEYDDKTALIKTEVDELYSIATEEEIKEEFDLINSGDEGPAYYRKVLAIVKWRRANGR